MENKQENLFKDLLAVFGTGLILMGVANYAIAKNHDGRGAGIDDRPVRSAERETVTTTRACITTGEGTGRIESYCADTPEDLIEAIRLDWDEGPQGTLEPQQKPNEMTAYITQYSEADSCHYPDKNGNCLMASGKTVYEGAVACPRDLELGTKVIIDGKTYTCEDRYSRWVDEKRGLPTFDIFVWKNPEGLHRADVIIIR